MAGLLAWNVTRAVGPAPGTRQVPQGTPVRPSLVARAFPCATESARLPATTVLCSSLRKERKKMAKVLKSHRKSLERRLSALSATEEESPVLSDLLVELRTLNQRLAGQREAALLFMADDSSDSSDSDNECDQRTLRSCSRRQQAGSSSSTAAASDSLAAAAPGSGGMSNSVGDVATTLVMHGRQGTVELTVPEPPEGWDWDEEEFRQQTFAGEGRIMLCQGGKCQRKGAAELLQAVSALAAGSPGIEVQPCKCVGACSKGAAMRVRQAGQRCAVYTQLTPEQLPEIFGTHFAAPAAAPAPAAPEAVPVLASVGAASAAAPAAPAPHAHAHVHAHAHGGGVGQGLQMVLQAQAMATSAQMVDCCPECSMDVV